MPELPEVETICRGLRSSLLGLSITHLTILNPNSFPHPPEDWQKILKQNHISQIERRGKSLLLYLGENWLLACHLKMTGQLLVEEGQNKSSLLTSNTRLYFDLSNQTRLIFNDQRKFGWIRLITPEQLATEKFYQNLGMEPLDTPLPILEKEFLFQVKRHKKAKIKSVILDQSTLAGVGNIYADEALWIAQIHPESLAGNLSDQQILTLLAAIIRVMNFSIQLGGSSIQNYLDVDGNPGNYLTHAKVFKRQGKDCLSCQSQIVKIKVGGRGTHLCPHCQPLY